MYACTRNSLCSTQTAPKLPACDALTMQTTMTHQPRKHACPSAMHRPTSKQVGVHVCMGPRSRVDVHVWLMSELSDPNACTSFAIPTIFSFRMMIVLNLLRDEGGSSCVAVWSSIRHTTQRWKRSVGAESTVHGCEGVLLSCANVTGDEWFRNVNTRGMC